MTPALAARDLSAGYGKLACVRDLDLEVHAGEVVVLLGANGAGKTTTMLTLAGSLRPLAGQVLWHGEPTSEVLHRRVRRGLGFVPEDRSVISTLTVAQNLRIGRGPVQAALDVFPELRALLTRKAGLLSGGEQRMLTLGRALAGWPSVLMADELSLGLAPLVVRRLLLAARQAADAGTGVLLVEQHARQALTVADRGYVLNRGKLVMSATAAELLADLAALQRNYLGN